LLNSSNSTDGKTTFFLIISFFKIIASHSLKISKTTLEPAGHFIKLTASFTVIQAKGVAFAEIIISPALTSFSLAGEPFITLLTKTHNGFTCTTAQTHSKSQCKESLKDLFSSTLKYSENLSQIHLTSPATAASSKSSLFKLFALK
jgi:hypothetical protein